MIAAKFWQDFAESLTEQLNFCLLATYSFFRVINGLQFMKYFVYSLNTQLHILLMQELHDIPLFFSLHNIAGTVKCTSPSLVMFRSAVLNAGYRISSTHVNPLGVKSDAPWDVIWDIMRCWVCLDCSYIYHKSKSASRVLPYELLNYRTKFIVANLNTGEESSY